MRIYYPEMGEKKPEAQIEARISYGGRKWYLKTTLELKGRGISKDDGHIDRGDVKWFTYHVTDLAFDKLDAQYTISSETMLD